MASGRARLAQEDRDHAQRLAIYNQNAETFRALNALMWQTPLIGMTLTGGLWFGVAKAEATPLFQLLLLFLTATGDVALIAVLARLRYIVERYLDWLRAFDANGFVDAPGAGYWTKPVRVRSMFQIMLLLAAVASLALMVPPAQQLKIVPKWSSQGSISFYDRQAQDLADAYEMLPFEDAHPELLRRLRGKAPLRVLDVGTGTGRDAAWIAAAGHRVTGVEPSNGMLQLAKELHPQTPVAWVKDSLPALKNLRAGSQYDLIVLSAVWMHVHPSERDEALSRLNALRAPGGSVYMTLRSGPVEPDRQMWPTSVEELQRLAKVHGLKVQDLGEREDLLKRPGVTWRTVLLNEGT
jgi:SAM-dependent methyltransferase